MEQKNMFENAKFGDKFITEDGRTAIYLTPCGDLHTCIIEGLSVEGLYKSDGTADSFLLSPIISKAEEFISEDKLDELALAKYPVDNEFNFELSKHMDGWQDKNERVRKAYKAGYRKAKEE